jgi:hypothetical protein
LKSTLIVSAFLLIAFSAYPQGFSKTYDWEKTPGLIKTDSVEHYGLIYKITDRKIKEIWIDNEGKGEFYETHHLKFKILTNGGVDLYNKMEVSLSGVEEIVRLKARTIKTNGTVDNLSTTAIKHITNYNETGIDYKVFVFEGLEIGSEVEYLYTFRRQPSVYGYSYIQWNVDAATEEFDLVYPAYLDFRLKAYGEGLTISVDTIKSEKINYVHRNIKNEKTKGIKSEPYANWKSHLARVDYVLDKNKDAGKYEMSTYKILAQNYYSSIYPDDAKPSKKAVALLKKIVSNSSDQIKTAKEIENYVKINFKTGDSPSDKNMNRIFGSFGGSTLDRSTAMVDLYRAAGFKVELVFTADNSNRRFDPAFETPSNCGEFLIYLPEIGFFTSPDNILLRSGYYDMSVFEQKGMFVKQVCVGEFCSGVNYISSIPSKKAEESIHDMKLDISFNADMASTHINFVNSMTGYHSSSFQPVYEFLDKTAQDNLKKQLVENFTGEYLDAAIEVENGNYNSSFDKPFILKGTANTETLLETAGDKYLFKVGVVLGEQYEMYDRVQRQLPIENDYNRIYDRLIKITIPPNYEISNMQDFQNNKILCDYNGKEAAGIIFEYRLDENIFTIKITEYYNILNLPLEEYEEYRSVINGAADFNKKVIVLSPKK